MACSKEMVCPNDIFELETMIGEMETSLGKMKKKLDSIKKIKLREMIVVNPDYKIIFEELKGKIKEALSKLSGTNEPFVIVRTYGIDISNYGLCTNPTVFKDFMNFYSQEYSFTEEKRTRKVCVCYNCDCDEEKYLYGYKVSPKNN